jgi:hypothetical protein
MSGRDPDAMSGRDPAARPGGGHAAEPKIRLKGVEQSLLYPGGLTDSPLSEETVDEAATVFTFKDNFKDRATALHARAATLDDSLAQTRFYEQGGVGRVISGGGGIGGGASGGSGGAGGSVVRYDPTAVLKRGFSRDAEVPPEERASSLALMRRYLEDVKTVVFQMDSSNALNYLLTGDSVEGVLLKVKFPDSATGRTSIKTMIDNPGLHIVEVRVLWYC